MRRATVTDEIAASTRLAATLGLSSEKPIILHQGHHTSIRFGEVVARIQSAAPTIAALNTAQRELTVAAHLAARFAPTLPPLLPVLAGPYVTAAGVLTFWPFIAARPATVSTGRAAANSLAAVHRAFADYSGYLPPYTDALDRASAALASTACDLRVEDRMLLIGQLDRLRRVIATADISAVPLHGDIHLGNILVTANGLSWLDFEDACRGPRELDFAGLPRDAWPCDADAALLRAAADLKSVTVAIWCTAEPNRSAAVRQAGAYHLRRVRRFAR